MGRRGIILILFVLGISLALTAVLWPTWNKDEPFVIATASSTRGPVSLIRFDAGEKIPLRPNTPVHNHEIINVPERSEVVLDFPDGGQVKVLENSLVSVEHPDLSTDLNEVQVKKGEVQILSPSPTGVLYIVKWGNRVESKNYAPKTEEIIIDAAGTGLPPPAAGATPDASPQSSPAMTTPTPAGTVKNEAAKGTKERDEKGANTVAGVSSDGQGLSNEYVAGIIKSQKNNFHRCYLQMLQNFPNSKGRISINFIVENTGKVSAANIESSVFKDENFHKCLTEVITRTNFKPFKGNRISLKIPLKFE
jgi:hypothetical protein